MSVEPCNNFFLNVDIDVWTSMSSQKKGRPGMKEGADEMAALDAVRDYEADPNVMLEDVPQDIVIKTLKVSCACVPVLVFACVCVYVRARDVDMCS